MQPVCLCTVFIIMNNSYVLNCGRLELFLEDLRTADLSLGSFTVNHL